MATARSDTQRPLLGGGLVMLAMLVIALIDNWVRYITPEMGLWQFHLLRSTLACVALLLVARAMGWRLTPNRWWAWGMRSALAAMSMILYFGAVSMMTLAQAGAGLFTSPIFVMILSVAVFGLQIGRRRLGAVVLGFGGTLLMLRPWDTEGVAPVAAAIAVTAGVFYALAALVTRQWCANEPTSALNMGYFAGMAVLGGIGLIGVGLLQPVVPPGPEGFFARGWVVPSAQALFWITLQALLGLAAIGLLIRGYQLAEASQVTIFEYSFLPFAALWSFVLFAESPDLWSIAGMSLIVLAGALIARAGAAARSGKPGNDT